MKENPNEGQKSLGRHDFLIFISSLKEINLPIGCTQQQQKVSNLLNLPTKFY